MVVLTGDRDVAIGGIETSSELGDGFIGVVAQAPRRRHRAVKERERVIPQVQDVEFEVVATVQSVYQPRDRLVGETARASRTDDDLDSQ